jgi:FMN phosphatase YigB (HAD superfamily)
LSRYKALIFDVDGTLYHQDILRRRMLPRLLTACATNLPEGVRVLRAIVAYRRAQEAMRRPSDRYSDLRQAQIEMASRSSGIDSDILGAVVSEWMERRPLGLVRGCLRAGAPELLKQAKESGCRLGVFSDYPAEEKLKTLGVRMFFDAVVCASDRDVQRFKPDPQGIEVTVRRLGVRKDEALYVGDRAEVDAIAAQRAGIGCAIIGRRRNGKEHPGHRCISQLGELADLLG